jgi:hypothetical protein
MLYLHLLRYVYLFLVAAGLFECGEATLGRTISLPRFCDFLTYVPRFSDLLISVLQVSYFSISHLPYLIPP